MDIKESEAAAKHWKEQGKPPPFCSQTRLHSPEASVVIIQLKLRQIGAALETPTHFKPRLASCLISEQLCELLSHLEAADFSGLCRGVDPAAPGPLDSQPISHCDQRWTAGGGGEI